MTIPDSLIAYSANQKFGISAHVSTGQNAIRYTTASKIYAFIRFFYSLP
jgi:hypothetical protein